MTDKSEIPKDLMEKAREVWKIILDDPTSNSNGVVFGHIARALMAERERATLAERERWQIPPGIPVRFDPNVPPGEVRLDANGAVIGTLTASRP